MVTKLNSLATTGLVTTANKADPTASVTSSGNSGKVISLTADGSIPSAYVTDLSTVGIKGQTSDPANPTSLEAVIWQAEGTGTGDAGDLLVKTTGPAVAASATFTFSDKPNEETRITIVDSDGTSVIFEVDNENNGIAPASATFTFSDKPNEGSTIRLTDSDGTVVIFEIDNENNGVVTGRVAVNGIAAAGGGATGTAADLVAKINAQSTLDIVATNPSTGKVLLKQGTTGTAGNTTITLDNATHWNTCTSVNVPSAFTGGVTAVALNGIAGAGGGATGTAADLVAKVNAQSALDITALSTGGGHIKLTQGTGGTGGNTTITLSDSTNWNAACSVNVPSAFTSGAVGTTKTATLVDWSAPSDVYFDANLDTDVSMSDSTWTTVTYDSENLDSGGYYNPSTGKFTPLVAGYYFIHASANIYRSGRSITFAAIRLNKNTTAVRETEFDDSDKISHAVLNVSGIIYLDGVDDYVLVQAYQEASVTTSQKIQASDDIETVFFGYRVF